MNTEAHRTQLRTLEQELVRRLGGEVEAARRIREDAADVGELSLLDEQKDESSALAETDTAILGEVRAALQRIDDGTYGRCVVDGGEIEPARLDAVPWTRYCLKHQQQIEAQRTQRMPTL